MTGTLSGLGASQQIPLSNTFQPGQTSVRPEQRGEQDKLAQARSTEPASVQKQDTGQNVPARATQSLSNDVTETKNARRGSVVDITV